MEITAFEIDQAIQPRTRRLSDSNIFLRYVADTSSLKKCLENHKNNLRR